MFWIYAVISEPNFPILRSVHYRTKTQRSPRIVFVKCSAFRTRSRLHGHSTIDITRLIPGVIELNLKEVLVFQANRVAVEEMRGASRFEEVLPVILTNAGDSPRGRSFTLLHELVHLALHGSGLCVPTTARNNIPRANPTEIFCNHVAGAILVPRERLIAHPIVAAERPADSWSDDELRSIANDFSVSRFVVLRRLVLLDRASAAFYDRKHQEWSAQIVAAPAGGDGRRTNLSARGRTFARLVLAAYGADKITLRDTARYLGIKAPDLQMARDYAWL